MIDSLHVRQAGGSTPGKPVSPIGRNLLYAVWEIALVETRILIVLHIIIGK